MENKTSVLFLLCLFAFWVLFFVCAVLKGLNIFSIVPCLEGLSTEFTRPLEGSPLRGRHFKCHFSEPLKISIFMHLKKIHFLIVSPTADFFSAPTRLGRRLKQKFLMVLALSNFFSPLLAAEWLSLDRPPSSPPSPSPPSPPPPTPTPTPAISPPSSSLAPSLCPPSALSVSSQGLQQSQLQQQSRFPNKQCSGHPFIH
jgi:hypothetical protein